MNYCQENGITYPVDHKLKVRWHTEPFQQFQKKETTEPFQSQSISTSARAAYQTKPTTQYETKL